MLETAIVVTTFRNLRRVMNSLAICRGLPDYGVNTKKTNTATAVNWGYCADTSQLTLTKYFVCSVLIKQASLTVDYVHREVQQRQTGDKEKRFHKPTDIFQLERKKPIVQTVTWLITAISCRQVQMVCLYDHTRYAVMETKDTCQHTLLYNVPQGCVAITVLT